MEHIVLYILGQCSVRHCIADLARCVRRVSAFYQVFGNFERMFCQCRDVVG
jgi:hypothetical protein